MLAAANSMSAAATRMSMDNILSFFFGARAACTAAIALVCRF